MHWWGRDLVLSRPLALLRYRSGRRERWGQSPPVWELEKIVGGADDGPLGAHLVDAAHQELAEPACLLDLPEHRLGELLAQPVGAGMASGLDLRAHGLDSRR